MAGVNYNLVVPAGTTTIYGGVGTPPIPPSGSIIQRYDSTSQWLGQGSVAKFICGPGDPEGFLFLGTKQGDGTRSGGAQQTIIDNYIARGSNALYIMAVRDPGDGAADQTPWPSDTPANGLDTDIMAQWEGWFDQLEAANIYVFFFLWDDHGAATPVFGNGDTSPAGEQTFITDLVNEFKHHKNIIWLIGEEYEEGFTAARAQAQADVIEAADSTLLIGNGQLSSNQVFDHQNSTNLRFFSLQDNVSVTPAQFNTSMNTARTDAEANDYIVGFNEGINHGSGASARQIDWALFMGGAATVMRYPETAETATVSDMNDMQRLVDFAEATTFYTMSPDNSLINTGTEYVLANPGNDYIAYAINLTTDMGITGMTAGTYDLLWQSCDTSYQETQVGVTVTAGTNTFTKPAAVSVECAVWLQRQ